jgi:hypothetical protein
LLFTFSFAFGRNADTRQETAKNQVARRTIIFMRDLGTVNDAVAICTAVILGIAPQVRIMDITHQVIPFSVEEGARFRIFSDALQSKRSSEILARWCSVSQAQCPLDQRCLGGGQVEPKT